MGLRVAALSDVHANAPALAAVLEEVEREAPDLVVFCGDLTWGSLPQETLALVRSLEIPARFVRGNADRAVAEQTESARGQWMRARHAPADLAFLASFEPTVLLDVEGLGPTCFCHGSPRSDEECVTERTPPARVRELMAGVDARVVVTGHVHVSHDVVVDGVRLVAPGSVGVPYEDPPGLARWALFGPDVELRRTPYDVDEAVALMRATDDPRAEVIAGLLLRPPSRDDVIADAEERVFAG
ncbi:MAG TPA: metallophosphoesterase family protein [Gaiellaceae bacterium]|nr:metallophosphoesterase family protein [Gaiellaceae bacterium]